MNIILTGSLGNIGKTLTQALVQKPPQAVCLTLIFLQQLSKVQTLFT